jgi:hypothetical protein
MKSFKTPLTLANRRLDALCALDVLRAIRKLRRRDVAELQ